MTVGITIAVLLNNTPETSEWDWKCSRSRDSPTIQNGEKSHRGGSPDPGDQNPNIKLEDSEPVFKLEDSKTWLAPAGVPSLKLLWQSPLDSLRQRTIKEESRSPELDRDDPTDSSNQIPEVNPELRIKSDPDFQTESPVACEEEENQNPLAAPGPSSSSSIHTQSSATPTPPAPKAPGRRHHHRRKSWPCQVHQCKGIFTNKRLYERHLSRDHRYKSTVCPICGKTLGRKDYMTDHIRSKRHRKALDAQKNPRQEA